jgi:hypothetical protein
MLSFLKTQKSKLVVTVLLLLILSLAGYSVIAQTDEPGPSEREVGNGQIDVLDETALDPLPDRESTLAPLYYFSGVLNFAGEKGTAIICTNLDSAESTLIEAKLFNYSGALVDTALVSINPLRTATFESTPIAFYIADVSMNSDNVEQGYGLISTDHKNVICTVQIMDAVNNPPIWMESLPVFGQSSCCSFLPVILN